MAILLFGFDFGLLTLDLAALIAIYLTVSISLNLEMGYAGIPNFGKALLFAVGATVGGGLIARVAIWVLGIKGNLNSPDEYLMMGQIDALLTSNIGLGLALLLLALVIAAAFGALVGFASSYPAIRLREDYLSMTLLAMAEFYLIFLNNYTPLINGSIGILVPDPFAWAGTSRFVVITAILVAFAAATYLYSERVARSPLGRVLRSIRDNESASEALGKDTTKVRRNVLIVASAICAMAGCLYSFYNLDANVTLYARFDWTILPWVMVIVGGASNNFGVAMGVIIFESINKGITYFKNLFSFLPFDVNWLQYLMVGVVLVVILIYRPEGIFKEKPSATLELTKVKELVLGKAAAAEVTPSGEPPPTEAQPKDK